MVRRTRRPVPAFVCPRLRYVKCIIPQISTPIHSLLRLRLALEPLCQCLVRLAITSRSSMPRRLILTGMSPMSMRR
jgi:hypothetical protein